MQTRERLLATALVAAALVPAVSGQVRSSGPDRRPDQLAEWLAHGFHRDEAQDWIDTGTGLNEARQWRDAGIPVAGWAYQWKEQGFGPGEAGLWARAKVNVYTAGDFRNAGFSLAEAQAWLRVDIRSALRAKEFRDRGFPPEQAGRWWRLKFFPEDAADWRDAGLDPDAALAWRYGEEEATYSYAGKVTSRSVYDIEWVREWKSAGFTVPEARRAGEYGVPIDEAKAWRAAGFGFDEGVEWKDAGFTPREAATHRAAGLSAVQAEATARPASTGDAIASLHSHIVVGSDASIDVTETFVVSNAPGGALEGYFERRLPGRVTLRRSASFGIAAWPSYHIVSVLKDNEPARYSVERTRSGNVTLRIGAREGDAAPLAHGTHTFTLRYVTDDRLIDLHDQYRFFFDVTESPLMLPAGRATATVSLPAGADLVTADGFAGPPNRRYFVAAVGETARSDRVEYGVTRPLRRDMGFAVAVHLTKTAVRPGLAQRFRHFDGESGGLLSAASLFGISALAALAYYLVAWHRVGRDPKPGTIVPIYEPPPISPALMRYLVTSRRRVDDRSTAATLVRLAQCGAIEIREREGFYRVEQTVPRARGQYADEDAFREALFAAGALVALDTRFGRRQVHAARRALRRALHAETKSYTSANSRYLVPGVVLTVAGAVAALLSVRPDADSDATIAVAATLVSLGLALNLVFWRLLRTPTVATRKLRDQIEGFRRVVEATYGTRPTAPDRVASDPPPSVAAHLPYAIALGIDAERAAIVTRNLRWYSGRSGGFSAKDFTRSMGRSAPRTVTA